MFTSCTLGHVAHMDTDDVQKIRGLIDDTKFAMVTAAAREGALHSRPMTLQETDDDNAMWFFIATDSALATQIAEDPRVNAAFGTKESWVSVAGTGTVVRDQERIDRLWNSFVEPWFDGRDDPRVALLRIDSSSAEYWDTPGGKVATVLSLVKSKVTGEPMTGDHGRAEL